MKTATTSIEFLAGGVGTNNPPAAFGRAQVANSFLPRKEAEYLDRVPAPLTLRRLQICLPVYMRSDQAHHQKGTDSVFPVEFCGGIAPLRRGDGR
jgi:hypothetical protein